MEKSIFQFIWKYSKRNQLALTATTLLTFPILYASLELPKRIINDAIGGTGEDVLLLGMNLSQTQFLMLLCVGFLLSVLANGLLKMHLNTMKGVLSERLLRRFRFKLLTRMLKFPRSYFRTTSQGELVSMVTSEAEPMGSFMGNMLSQPVFQAGQMLTILVFLFAQSFWFGVASIALIPLQAWIIPKLQRQINVLNKERIKEVRKFAADIGETAAGVSDIRMNGRARHRLSLFSNRLGNLFSLRFKIYQKKFFMKFLNNFINQLTPFFFYSVGGYLAIKGDVTVGALIAALAAYKDLSSPWKELLAYYNQTQDMALRWELVIERFAPKNLVTETLFDGESTTLTSLSRDIDLVHDKDRHSILEGISSTIPKGAFSDVLTREVTPQKGTVKIAGHEMNDLHQTLVSNRIGDASSKPYAVGENLFMPFNDEPAFGEDISVDVADWVAPQMAWAQSCDESQGWLLPLDKATGTDNTMVRRGRRTRLAPDTQQVNNFVQMLQGEALYHRFRVIAPLLYNVVTTQGGEHLFAVFRDRRRPCFNS